MSVPSLQAVMAQPKLQITVREATLVRIFDSLSTTQNLLTSLVCLYDDGQEKTVGQTDVCRNGNRNPKWNFLFVCGRGAGKMLRFQVKVDHTLRNQVVCGEAEVNLEEIWREASTPTIINLALYKKGEKTGVLSVGLQLVSDDDGQPIRHAEPRAQRQGLEPSTKRSQGFARRQEGSGDVGSPKNQPSQFEKRASNTTSPRAPMQAAAPDRMYREACGAVNPSSDSRTPPYVIDEAGRHSDRGDREPFRREVNEALPRRVGPQRSDDQARPQYYPDDRDRAGFSPGHHIAPAAAPLRDQRVHKGIEVVQAPPPPPAVASQGQQLTGQSGQWWNSFIDRG